jgi:multiple sugar transport system permease protein
MKIFFQVVVPMVLPAIATVGILAFQIIWNDTSTSTLFFDDESQRTLAFFLQTLTASQGNTVAGQGMAAAASLIMFVPNLILFILLQSQVMSTMTHSGLK